MILFTKILNLNLKTERLQSTLSLKIALQQKWLQENICIIQNAKGVVK